jgi:hypothetical protein
MILKRRKLNFECKKKIPGIEPGYAMTINIKKGILREGIDIVADADGLHRLSTKPNLPIEKSKYFKYINSIHSMKNHIFTHSILRYFFFEIDLKMFVHFLLF